MGAAYPTFPTSRFAVVNSAVWFLRRCVCFLSAQWLNPKLRVEDRGRWGQGVLQSPW